MDSAIAEVRAVREQIDALRAGTEAFKQELSSKLSAMRSAAICHGAREERRQLAAWLRIVAEEEECFELARVSTLLEWSLQESETANA